METLENLVGNQEDWGNYITNVEMRDQPLMDWLPVGEKPVNPIHDYQADKFRVPRRNVTVDGNPWKAPNSAGDNRGRLKALIQWFQNGTAVSKLTQDVTNVAGVTDELARDIPKSLKEMAQDMECTFADDQDHVEGNTLTIGYETRGIGSWIASSQQTTYPVPTAFLTPAASIISSSTLASKTEDNFRDMLASMWRTCKSREGVTGFVGETLKRKVSDFQFYLPSSASTQATGVVHNYNGRDKTITRAIDMYTGDFMPVDLVLTPWLVALTGTLAQQQVRGYFLHRSKWMLRWNQKPKVYRPEFKGGSYEAYMDAIVMLACLNPAAEGKMSTTT
jgi:hypothetical protein